MNRVVSAEFTGDIPLVSFGIKANPGFEELTYCDMKFMGAGNLDAPMLIPSGGIRIGFEDMLVANTVNRDYLS